MAEFKIIESTLLSIGDFLTRELQRELIKQGHKLTGALVDSVDSEVKKAVDKIELRGTMFFYGRFVEEGVLPEQIKSPFAPQRIEGLTKWVQIKFAVDAKKAKGIAFAIATIHKKVGMPSRNKRFAPEKTSFLTNTLDRNEDRINRTIEDGTLQQLDVLLTNVIRNTQKLFKLA